MPYMEALVQVCMLEYQESQTASLTNDYDTEHVLAFFHTNTRG